MIEKDMDVFIICGGLGKRLRPSVNDRPKSMAEIDGKPFLDCLIGYIASFGFRRFILGIGHKGDYVKRYYEKNKCPHEILFSQENEPLGTGGSLKQARHLIKTGQILVVNGDSFCEVDLEGLNSFHRSKEALLSMALVFNTEVGDYGTVKISDSQQITCFDEKKKGQSGRKNLINAGIYVFEKSVFSLMPKKQIFSLEKDFFPNLVGNRFYGFTTYAPFFDIGTPERYEKTQEYLRTKLNN